MSSPSTTTRETEAATAPDARGQLAPNGAQSAREQQDTAPPRQKYGRFDDFFD